MSLRTTRDAFRYLWTSSGERESERLDFRSVFRSFFEKVAAAICLRQPFPVLFVGLAYAASSQVLRLEGYLWFMGYRLECNGELLEYF